MGKGFIVGSVITPEEKYAKGAYVKLVQVMSGKNQINVPQAGYGVGKGEDYTNSNGGFMIPFTWSGAEFANFEDTTEIGWTWSPVTIILVAWTEKNTATRSTTTASATLHTPG